MFDFGFSELIIIAVVALVVVGPERLPKVARTAGHLLGRLQRYVSDVKSDIQREMQLEELKKLQQQVEDQARELESSMRTQVQGLESDLNKTAAEIKSGISEAPAPAAVEEASPVAIAAPAVTPATSGEQSAAPEVDPRQLELGLGSARATTSTTDKA